MSPEQKVRYEQQQMQANIMREFVQHPGMKLLTDKLNKRIDLKRTEWLSAKTAEEAEVIRQDSRCYAALMGMVNEFLVRGEIAQRTINNDPVQ